MIDGRSLLDIAWEYGTPSYVFDVDAFRQRLRAVSAIFGEEVALCFAVKANPFLVRAAADEVARLEACSPGELDICRAAGVDPSKIVFSGVNKTALSVREALDCGVGVLTAESLKHVALIQAEGERLGKRVDVLLRLNAGSQFGMSRDDLRSVVERRGEHPNLNITGIHYFAGTQRMKLKHQVKELALLSELIEELRVEYGFVTERLEYGPGLGVPLFEGDDFSDTLAPARELAGALRACAGDVQLTVEMGRFFAAECGTYLTAVNDVKSNEGVDYCIVDGGINHLTYIGQLMGMKVPIVENLTASGAAGCGDSGAAGRAASGAAGRDVSGEWCGASDAAGHAASGAARHGDSGEWCVCGSLCTTGDVLTRCASLGEVHEGDVLAFRNCGAYSVTEGVYLFLSRTMPRIVMVENGTLRLARDFIETSVLNMAGPV